MAPASQHKPEARFGGGERRQVTVVFSDLAGSTELSTHLDPEDYLDVVAAYHRTATAAVNRFGGHIVKYLGDGVLALFGYPRAHEDDAERGVGAGLAILEGVREIATGEADNSRLAARVGVHTGEAVIAGGDTVDVFGEAPNVAARVQSAAEVDSLYVSAETLRLLGDTFVVESRGTHALKGVREPLTLYCVRRAAVHQDVRPGVARRAALIGREREREQLIECWRQACAGRGGTVLISGDPGIGKTSLLRALREHVLGEEHSWLAGETSPYHQQTDLYPFRSLLASDELLSSVLVAVRDAAVEPSNPDRNRERVLSLIPEWIANQARSRPTVLAIEDLHWADASTIELVGRLATRAGSLPLLIVLTARPELERTVAEDVELLRLKLGPLAPADARSAALARAPLGSLSEESIERIVARSDGVPLFVEELVDFFLEAGAANLDELHLKDTAIPATLQSLLMNRIDRLGAAKSVAQIGAVFGREVPLDLLRSVSKMSPAALESSLSHLERAGVLTSSGSPAERKYAFRHALVRDAAYALLLRRARKTLHRDTANALVQEFAAEAEQHPEIVAHHYELADEHALAGHYWRRSAEAGMARGAYVEVIEQLRRGFKAVAKVGEAGNEDAFVMHLLLAQALQGTRGSQDQDVLREYEEARARCAELADSPHLADVLIGTYEVAVLQGAMDTAREVVMQLWQLGNRRNDAGLLTCAYGALGAASFAAGDFLAANEAFDQVALHHRAELRNRDFMVGLTARSYRLVVSCLLGKPEKALRECAEELQRVMHTDHPFAQVTIFNGVALTQAFRGDAAATREIAEQLRAVAHANGYGLFEKTAICQLAISRLLEGQGSAAVADLESGIERIIQAGQETWPTIFVPFLAQGFCDIGAPERALAIAERGIADGEQRGHAVCRAEFERVRALALELLESPADEVVAAYESARATARRQGARVFELRAALGLTRFRRAQGDTSDAAQTLAEALAEWTEGRDMRDIAAAEALLHELNQSAETREPESSIRS